MMRRAQPTLPKPQSDSFVPNGGLDQITPPLQMADGACRAMQNFEQGIRGGYRRIEGYERWAGNIPTPRVTYATALLRSTGGYNLYAGQHIQGATSGARAYVLGPLTAPAPNSLVTVNLAAGVPQDVLLFNVTGVFELYETIQQIDEFGTALSVDLAVYGLAEEITGADAQAYAQAVQDCDDVYRAAIAPFDTSAFSKYKIVGVAAIDRVVYQFVVYKLILDPSAAEYTTLMILTPSLTDPTVAAVVPGSWGWEQAGAAIPLDGTNLVFPVAPERIDFVEYNFTGATDARRLYGVSGIGKGFSFDGTTVTAITTGMTGTLGDKPQRQAIHKDRLFYSFGSSLQFSAAGNPTSWTPVLGAGEISMGEDITALMTVVGNDQASSLLVGTDRGLAVLYGDTSATFNLVWVSREMGIRAGSLQIMASPLFVNDYGVTSLAASQAFGNFEMATLSQSAQDFITDRLQLVTCSLLVRSKNQYRVFFSDGTALYFTFKGSKLAAITPARFDRVVRRAWITLDYAGRELIVFASDDPQVYRMEVGRNFDGQAIDAFLFMSFNHLSTPRLRKAFRRLVLEVACERGYVAFQGGADVDHGGPDVLQSPESEIENNLATLWDEFTWDDFTWDTGSRQPTVVPIDGTGKNVSLWMRCNSELVEAFTVTGVMTEYFARRGER